jgi:hypothetical protein
VIGPWTTEMLWMDKLSKAGVFTLSEFQGNMWSLAEGPTARQKLHFVVQIRRLHEVQAKCIHLLRC